MKRRKRIRSLLTLAVAAALLLGSVTTAPVSVLTAGNSASIDVSCLNQFGQYNITRPIIKWGEMPKITLRSNGTPIYCIDMAISISGSSVNAAEMNQTAYWNKHRTKWYYSCQPVRASQQYFGVSDDAAYAATKLVIWE